MIPLGPIIFVIFNTITLNFRFIADTRLYKRPFSEKAKSIGLWENIMEFVIIISVAVNTGLFYFGTINQFNQYYLVISQATNYKYDSGFDYGDFELNLFYIIIIEHGFLAFIFILKFVVDPCPHWILKENETLLQLIEDAKKTKLENEIEMVEQAFQTEVIKIKKVISEKEKELKELREKNKEVTTEIEVLQASLLAKNEFIEQLLENHNYNLEMKPFELFANRAKDYQEEIKKEMEDKYRKIIRNIVKKIMTGEKILLNIDKEDMDIEISMQKMFVISQLTRTFNKIEKEIISRKLEKLIFNLKDPIMICNHCNLVNAQLICKECEDFYCQDCFEAHKAFFSEEHISCRINFDAFQMNKKESNMETRIFRDETMMFNATLMPDLNQKEGKQSKNLKVEGVNEKEEVKQINPLCLSLDAKYLNNMDGDGVAKFETKKNIKNKKTITRLIKNDDNYITWFKMENSYFPSSSESKNYQNLETIFEILRKEYIIYNGIDNENNIDLQTNITDSMSFLEMVKSNPSVAHSVLFDQNQEINKLNLEELFILNRMVFLRFKRVGSNLTVYDLFENLKILQVNH
jgi:hypothetical protein